MDTASDNKPLKLHLGCGHLIVPGWVNVDYAAGARFARIPFFRTLNRRCHWFRQDWDHRIFIHNLLKPFPWPDGSVAAVYCSHTLEHFSKTEGLAFLKECHRVLRPDGRIRIVVPDLAHWVTEYTRGDVPADEFLDRIGVLYGDNPNPLKRRLLPFIQFPHKCLYDAPALLRVMRQSGFDATPRSPFDSDLADIHMLEMTDRTEHAVIAEGRRGGKVLRP